MILILLPAAIAVGLISAGYRAFRYGEEVEEMQEGARKATLSLEDRGPFKHLKTGMRIYEELSELIE